MSHFLEQLRWRYATKQMNGQPVSAEKLENILEAIRLSASSYGLQPYTVLVVQDPEVRKQLQPACWGQSQIVDSAAVLVFCAWADITEAQVDAYLQNTATTRQMPVEGLADFKKYIMGSVNSLDVAGRQAWAARQAYIALGTALVACAAEQVDSTPMEGFAPDQVDAILGLHEKGLRSVVLCPIGYRAESDWLAKVAKVRRSKEELFQFV